MRVPSRADDLGGKSAGIQALQNHGVSVPRTHAFSLIETLSWVAGLPGFDEAIEAWAHWKDMERLEALRARVLAMAPPPDWSRICARIRAWSKGSCIVRSSMSVEDGASLSFAGAYESVALKSWDESSLWGAVTRVIASAYSNSAAKLLLSSKQSPRDFRPGVLIQEWVEPVFSGVCLSRSPDRIRDRAGYVEWIRGVGEALVQGTGGTKCARQDDAVPEDLKGFWPELWQVASQSERILKCPADLEWVYDGARLWFVQLRPVAGEESQIADGRWSRELSQERFPEKMTPLGWSVISDTLPSNLRSLEKYFGLIADSSRQMAASVRGVVYSDPDFFKFPDRVRIRWSHYLSPRRRSLWKLLGSFSRWIGRGFGSREIFKLDVLNSLLDEPADEISSVWKSHVETHMRQLDSFSRGLPDRLGSAAEILEAMNELRKISLGFLEPDLSIFLIKDSFQKGLSSLWISLNLSPSHFSDLVTYFEDNRTLMMSEHWGRWIGSLKSDPARSEFIRLLRTGEPSPESVLQPRLRELWKQFLEENGHSRTSWDLALPCWKDEPRQMLSWIEASLNEVSLSSTRSALKSKEERAQLRASARKLFFDSLEANHLSKCRPRVEEAVDQIEAFMRMDEELHFLTGHLLNPSRTLVLAAAGKLVSQGLLTRCEDVFFLELSELKRALEFPDTNLSFLAERRRKEWAREDRVVQASPEASWKGIPVSAGIAEGSVCHAESFSADSRTVAGSILVTKSPNPAYVPLYPVLGGIISESGGLLSHGFVAAREFGIPAVSGIANAMQLLKPGVRVRIDGRLGTIEIL